MIASYLVAAVLGQVPTKPESFILPVLGGQREIVLGPLPHRNEFQGYYYQQASGVARGNMFKNQAIGFQEVRAGYMSWSVASYPHNGKQAWLLQTEGEYKQVIHPRTRFATPLINKMKISYWIDPDGKLLEEDAVTTLPIGIWTMSATIKDSDSYDLYLKSPIQKASTVTVYPKGGTAPLIQEFVPMVKDGKVVLSKKDFAVLDPINGTMIPRTATYGGHFAGKMFNDTPYHGIYVDLTGVGGTQRVYVSDAGDLMRVEMADDHFLTVEEKPGGH